MFEKLVVTDEIEKQYNGLGLSRAPFTSAANQRYAACRTWSRAVDRRFREPSNDENTARSWKTVGAT
jgi:hypothetical protein